MTAFAFRPGPKKLGSNRTRKQRRRPGMVVSVPAYLGGKPYHRDAPLLKALRTHILRFVFLGPKIRLYKAFGPF